MVRPMGEICRRPAALAALVLGLGLGIGACGDDEARSLDVDAATDAAGIDVPSPDASFDGGGSPVLVLDQATYTIGPDPVLVSGDTDAALMTLRNNGLGPARDLVFTVSPASGELDILSNCGTVLAGGAACTVSAQLNPSSSGMKMFTVTVASAEGPGDSAMVSGLAGARVRITVTNLAVGATMIDGRVQAAPAGIDCGMGATECEFIYTIAGPVVLTAIDGGDGTLVDWGISGCPVTGPCVLDLRRNVTATTVFHAPIAITSDSGVGIADEANGVDLDVDGSIVFAGAQGTSALLARVDGAVGGPLASFTYGPATRRSLDVSIAPNRTVATAGEENGDATLSISGTDLASEPARHVIAGAGTDRSNGICHDDMNRTYLVGDHGDRMSWGRWPAGSATPEYLFDTATPQGVALGATWDADVLWIAGGLAVNTAWLGKVDATNGTLTTPTTVAGARYISSVATYGAAAGGQLVVAGWTPGSLVVRRYDATLTEVWTRTYASAADIRPDLAIDAETGAIYVAYDEAGGCALRKLSGDGAPIWIRSALGTHCEDVAVDVDGAVVVGWTLLGGTRKYFVRKYFH